MKGRPRSVEREVARCLTSQFVLVGFTPVERIPVLGRTGPDLSINELGLAIDVKSRLTVPLAAIVPQSGMIKFQKSQLIGVRLNGIDRLCNTEITFEERPYSKTVVDWWEHMDEWRRDRFPEGISTLVLHRPGTWVQNATFIIHLSDKEKLYDRYNNRTNNFRIPAKLQSQSVSGAGWFAPSHS